jgi:hypothetical protein
MGRRERIGHRSAEGSATCIIKMTKTSKRRRKPITAEIPNRILDDSPDGVEDRGVGFELAMRECQVTAEFRLPRLREEPCSFASEAH